MAEYASSARRSRGSLLERYFRFGEYGTTLARDTMAGVTTFVVMSYIIFLNPTILSFSGVKGLEGKGLPFDGVLTSTCLVAAVATIAMGLYTNRAYALAPDLGINAIVAFQLVATEGLSFPAAMGLIVVEGIAVTVLVLTGLREQVMRAIPLELKKAIAIGIGFFIAFIGLYDAGIVVRGTGTPLELSRFTTWPILVTLFGIVLTIALRARGFRGDLLIGIVATTILATIVNESASHAGFTSGARGPDHVVEHPDFSLLGNFNSTPSRSSVCCRRSSGRSRSSSPTSSTRWARSSALASRPGISRRTASCRRSASRCSSTRSPRSQAARRRRPPPRRTSSRARESRTADAPVGWQSSAARCSSPSCSSRRSSAWFPRRRPPRRSSSSAT